MLNSYKQLLDLILLRNVDIMFESSSETFRVPGVANQGQPISQWEF